MSEFDHRSAVDAAWARVKIVETVRSTIGALSRADRISVLLQVIAEIAPEEAPTSLSQNPRSSTLVSGYSPFSELAKRDSSPGLAPKSTGRSVHSAEEIAQRRERVLSAIPTRDIGTTVLDIVEKTKVLATTLHHDLKVLHEQGYLARVNRNRWRRLSKPMNEGATNGKSVSRAPKTKKEPKVKEPKAPTSMMQAKSELPPSKDQRRDANPNLRFADERRLAIYKVLDETPRNWKEIAKMAGVGSAKGAKYYGAQADLRMMGRCGMAKLHGWSADSKWSKGTRQFNRDVLADESNNMRGRESKKAS
jgi:hypothetical protein